MASGPNYLSPSANQTESEPIWKIKIILLISMIKGLSHEMEFSAFDDMYGLVLGLNRGRAIFYYFRCFSDFILPKCISRVNLMAEAACCS